MSFELNSRLLWSKTMYNDKKWNLKESRKNLPIGLTGGPKVPPKTPNCAEVYNTFPGCLR